MARDRQRAKQRRRERQAGGGDTGAREDATRDAGIEDDSVPSPLGEGTAAPDPLAHSSAEVDQARLAEAGAVRGGSGDADADPFPEDHAPAPDATVEELSPTRRGDLDPSVAEETAPGERRQRGRVLAFLGHCVDELRRVRWPDRRQVGQATAVVLGFVVIAGGFLGLMDALWRPIVQAII